MSDLFVMRRANGDLFTEVVGGKVVLPVWRGRDSVERYKVRNPELMFFLPAPLDHRLLTSRFLNKMDSNETPAELFLLAGDDPEADLDDGRPFSPQEVMSITEQAANQAGAGA
jgi:hypothetical protein